MEKNNCINRDLILNNLFDIFHQMFPHKKRLTSAYLDKNFFGCEINLSDAEMLLFVNEVHLVYEINFFITEEFRNSFVNMNSIADYVLLKINS